MAAPRRIARFELVAQLGQGAQATVWRAHDPTLQRDVALKLLHAGADLADHALWLNEARLAGALHHPGIVPVFDAGMEGSQAWIVSECVSGPTLADRLQDSGPWPVRDAVTLVSEVLDALAAAHAQGVVHRDLKPSNILLGQDGRPRVMDFGIAARLSAAHDGRIVGTPGYISPEAARGDAPAPAMDVFAAGMLLGRLLTGQPLRAGADALQALRQATDEDVCWPTDCDVDVDDALRSIVLRATARDAARRWADAASFREALQAWLFPAAAEPAPASHGTLSFLLRRMRLNSDFPALSDAVLRIQRITSSDSESLHALATEVLRDVALTHKLLRLVNSALFRRSGTGEISTVSRAAAMVGFSGIRNMALSLLLVEHMGDKAHARRMKALFLEALLTATLVDQLTPASREREEAFLAGMLSQLGRLLAEYYFPEEAARIRGASDEQAERVQIDVLGLSYQALGQGVAGSWGLPDSLRRLMAPPPGPVPGRAVVPEVDRMRWRVRAAAELVQVLLADDPQAAALTALAERFARPLACATADVLAAVQVARSLLPELAAGLGLDAALRGPARRLLARTDEATLATVRESSDPQRVQRMLSAGIADVTASLAGDSFRLNEVLRMILETMWRGLGLRRVVFSLRDARHQQLVGRLALGEQAEQWRDQCRVSLVGGPAADLFTASCLKGADTLISDARAAKLSASLPDWLREAPPRSFLLLPLMLKGAPFGLIYADRGDAPLQPSAAELDLLRTLRNQAVLAFKASA